jgi:hypothetical protein
METFNRGWEPIYADKTQLMKDLGTKMFDHGAHGAHGLGRRPKNCNFFIFSGSVLRVIRPVPWLNLGPFSLCDLGDLGVRISGSDAQTRRVSNRVRRGYALGHRGGTGGGSQAPKVF